MYRLCLLVIVLFNILLAFVFTSEAALTKDYQLYLLTPYWQFKGGWENLTYDHINSTIRKKGCSLISLAMILRAWGFSNIPQKWPYCGYTYDPVDPQYLNNWLKTNGGYNREGDIKWLSVKKFYFCDWYGFTTYLEPSDQCYPTGLRKCFLMDWSSTSEQLLDYDLLNRGWPTIAKINYSIYNEKVSEEEKRCQKRNHFVVISGYKLEKQSYTAHDPGKSYNPWETPTIISLAELYKGDSRCPTLKPYEIVRLYRYQGVLQGGLPNMGYIYGYPISPIEYQIINPYGFITGYDPETGGEIEEIPGSEYFDEAIDSIDPEDPPTEPKKVFMINEPPSGNYIIRIFGVGDGPYSFIMTGSTPDGTDIPDTPVITGTAYPGMVEVYRLQYSSSTGQGTVSNTNQLPVANAGTDQTVLTGDTVTLNGSGSYDPDGDPLKYTWEIISKPAGSIATLLNSETKTPSLVPDIAGQYVVQLTVSDFFVNSTSADTVVVTAIEPTYIDITLRALRAPSRMVLGDTKEVTIVVKNLSSVDANFKVTLEDLTEGKVIGTATGIEGAGRGGTRVKIPYTPTTSGTHTLKATVMVTNPYSRDPNMGNNILTDTTLVVVR